MALLAAHLNAGVILVVTAGVADRYIQPCHSGEVVPLTESPRHLHAPSPPLWPVPNKPYDFCGRYSSYLRTNSAAQKGC